jgi:pyruvate/2-oxoglutarate/acetoin dehydrogenase E1 component
MKEDERVSYFGEDVASEEGGVLALTKGLLEAFGKDRISNTPITEEANAAAAAGMAFAGGKPITEFQFATFFSNAFSLLFVIAPQWYQKGMRAGFVTVYPSGIVHTGGSGHYHEAWVERYLPLGIVIVAPSNAYDLVGLMRAAHEYDGPVAILIQISAAGSAEFRSDVPIDPYVIPFGKAKIIREGADCTVAAYGAACVAAAKNEADAMMKEEGINVEVIDLRTVEPWDKETLLTSVEKTGYLILMHEDSVDGGMGERIIGGLMKEIRFFKSLKAPAFVVGALYPCVPSAKVLIWDRLPYELVVIGKDKLHRSQRLRKEIIRVRSKAEARGENDG